MAVTVAWRITIRSESQTIPFTVFSQSGVGMVRSVAAKKSAAKKTPLPACARELHSIFHHVSYHAWRYKGVTNIRYYKKFFVFSPIFNTFEPRAAEMTGPRTFRWFAAWRLRHLARRAFRFFENPLLRGKLEAPSLLRHLNKKQKRAEQNVQPSKFAV